MATVKEEYAFPQSANGVFGMTLRDYFAAKAMNGYLSQDGFMEAMEQDNVEVIEMANAFYSWADAMLKARSK